MGVGLVMERVSGEEAGLQIYMFGHFRCIYQGQQVLFGKKPGTRVMNLLILLLYSTCTGRFGKNGIPRPLLLEYLFGKNSGSAVMNNLRVAVYHLKAMLAESGLPDYDYICIEDGECRWKSPGRVWLDVEEFMECIVRAEMEPDAGRKALLMEQACLLYRDGFLPEMADEEWASMNALFYKYQYARTLERVFGYLKGQQEYEKILRLSEQAAAIYPLDGWQALKIDALLCLNRQQEAFRFYEEVCRLLTESTERKLSGKVLELVLEMGKQLESACMSAEQITKGLAGAEQGKGALFCSLPSFRDSYRMVQRMLERSGRSAFLMVCSIIDSRGDLQGQNKKLAVYSENLCQAIQKSLRKGDLFTRLNTAQYLILLIGTSQEYCRKIFGRILNRFSENGQNRKKKLRYTALPVEITEYENSEICSDGTKECNERRADKSRLRAGGEFASPNLINICVDSTAYGELSGRLYCRGFREPLRFGNLVELMWEMDAYFDRLSYPEPEFLPRSFEMAAQKYRPGQTAAAAGSDSVTAPRGRLASFCVSVNRRQNATWQGTLYWVEQEQTGRFQSELEMVEKIERALASSG